MTDDKPIIEDEKDDGSASPTMNMKRRPTLTGLKNIMSQINNEVA